MPREVSREVIGHVVIILFGICIWDFVTSLWFEYRLLTKKIRFRWPFAPYFLARYLVLVHVTSSVTGIFIDVNAIPLCTYAALITANIFIGLLAIVFSTWNLLIRTVVIWGYNPLVTKLLFAIGFIHLLVAFITPAIGRHPCVPLLPSAISVMIFRTTSATIDLVILVLSLVGIRRASRNGDSPLARLLRTQGAAYFVMLFFLNVFMIIVSCVYPDGVASMCVGAFASALGPVLSCRFVTSTLSQSDHMDGGTEAQMHCVEHLELSEGQDQSSSGRMTTFIDIPKDQSPC